MATEKQMRANRRNAAESTGPRTVAGKLIASRNALTHGLTAEQVILEGEDAARFEALRAALVFEFEPEGPTEVFLVERLTSLTWRLGRVPAFEAGLFAWVSHQQAEAHDLAGVSLGEFFFSGDRRALAPPKTGGSSRNRQRRIGRTLEVLTSKTDPLGRLARYEGHLMRQVERTLKELGTRIGKRGGVIWRRNLNGGRRAAAPVESN
jgi:hypothetical protein